MKNSNELEKSRGVVLFAFNSKTVDYVKIAQHSARLIKKSLNLPVTVVTDSVTDLSAHFDSVINYESKTGNVRFTKDGKLHEWKNFDRFRVYELVSYDEVILLDVDYLVLDQSLLKLLDQNFDVRLMYKMHTPAGPNTDEMGPMSLPMVWATVVLFKKSPNTKIFFDLVGRIQRNYGYYRTLFGIRETNYRNDFAFSMANIILNGYDLSEEKFIPWPMLTIENDIQSLKIDKKFLLVKHSNHAHAISLQNLHIMDKQYLLSDNFELFVEDFCNE
jgi:hypothetical protein